MIFGCDLGSRRIAIVCPQLELAVAVRMPKKKVSEQANAAADAHFLADFVRTNVPTSATLWIEKAIVGGSMNRSTAIHMGIANGAVVGAHLGQSHFVLPSVWKARVVGHGGADKKQTGDWLAHHHPALAAACEDDEDLADATCVGLYGFLDAQIGVAGACSLSEFAEPQSVLRQRRQSADAQERRRRRAQGLQDVPSGQ